MLIFRAHDIDLISDLVKSNFYFSVTRQIHQIQSIQVDSYEIQWSSEENKNVVVFSLQVFTASQTWTFAPPFLSSA